MKRKANLLLTSALWLYVIIAAGFVSLRYNQQFDWTANNRNTLTAASATLLQTLPDPIQATAWVYPSADARREISARFAPYLREKDNFSLTFRDPASDPQAIRTLGIGESGEVVLEYRKRHEKLSVLSEPDITAALQRLGQTSSAHLVFLTGHGERDLQDDSQSGYTELSTLLQDKGLRVSRHSLATESLPDDAQLVVLAAPQRALTPGEINSLQRYLDQGRNLLLLSDPGLPVARELLATLGLKFLDGTLIYQDYEQLGSGHPAMALVAEYPAHALGQSLTDISAFAGAAGLMQLVDSPWNSTALLNSVPRSWLETGPMGTRLEFDQDADLMGPVSFGFALERDQPAGTQRAVVIADSDFLANGYLTQVGNRPLAVALFQWLVGRDDQIAIDLPPAPDASLSLSPLATSALAVVFVLALPLFFLTTGMLRWWLRRRRR
ncbi:hypothetical protein ATO7_15672 [Oceanococcus atlanticus]|uniref:DUF4350 domain-containing protein n=1 Tax=Oceanococcus atlanticus TaxID=1317117 RepID=A0A1Y1SA73_9GAMM|nr:DUF4350 domain-containing protein [Oceanococcus atlanticus]ORE85236.1 hypothetical protein ATO7_15672 [Oceanococcus atlanticus]